MASLVCVVCFFLAGWLAWSCGVFSQRNAGKHRVAQHVLGALHALWFSFLIGYLTLPPLGWWGGSTACFLLLLAWVGRQDLKAGKPLFGEVEKSTNPPSIGRNQVDLVQAPENIPPSTPTGLSEEVQQRLDERLRRDRLRSEKATLKGFAKRNRIKTASSSNLNPVVSPNPVKKQAAPKKAKRQLKPTTSGSTLRFIYHSASSGIRERELKNWKDDGAYIIGWDLSVDKIRTFRKDRVISYISGHEDLVPMRAPVAGSIQTNAATILFTGFRQAKRTELELLAQGSGMKVVKTVAQHLSYLCCGANAGGSKMSKALEVGAVLLTEGEFLWLLKTGEIPMTRLENTVVHI